LLDFPASPTVGQQFTAAGVTWIWDGHKWLPSGLSPTIVPGINDNRIINGDMRIDQRNNGASGTAASVYTVDRWQFVASSAAYATWGRSYGGGIGPSGFPYYLGIQCVAHTLAATDYFAFQQAIEADAISDFQWGTVGAQAVTLSFWAYSNVTGIFGGAVANYANTRTYPFSYSIPTANTWIKIALTIPGDTAGAWVMSGGGGALKINFSFGVGATYSAPAGAWVTGNYASANGAVSIFSAANNYFFVTGVKLEIGSVATPYNRQSLAKSLADCQRYYNEIPLSMLTYVTTSIVFGYTATYPFMRSAPTITPIDVILSNCSDLTIQSPQPSSALIYASTTTGPAGAQWSATFVMDAEL
jgi:hypothetical protein